MDFQNPDQCGFPNTRSMWICVNSHMYENKYRKAVVHFSALKYRAIVTFKAPRERYDFDKLEHWGRNDCVLLINLGDSISDGFAAEVLDAK